MNKSLTLYFFIFSQLCFNAFAMNREGEQPSASSCLWAKLYQNSLLNPLPCKTLDVALLYFSHFDHKIRGNAADIGCGAGNESLLLLSKGWTVTAIDIEPYAIELLEQRVDSEKKDNLTMHVAAFKDMVLPANLDLVNASYSLPFCHPQDFDVVWENIVDHLAVGGRFAGHFFGPEDARAADQGMTIIALEDVRTKLFGDRFVIEYLQTEEGPLMGGGGKVFYWHVFHVVAKKIK